jgi:hypothetical protein
LTLSSVVTIWESSSIVTVWVTAYSPGLIVPSNAEGRQRSPVSLPDSPDSPHPNLPPNADGTHGNPNPISDPPDLSKPSKNVPATSIDRLLGSCGQGDSSLTIYRWLDDNTIECVMRTFEILHYVWVPKPIYAGAFQPLKDMFAKRSPGRGFLLCRSPVVLPPTGCLSRSTRHPDESCTTIPLVGTSLA